MTKYCECVNWNLTESHESLSFYSVDGKSIPEKSLISKLNSGERKKLQKRVGYTNRTDREFAFNIFNVEC